MRCLGLDRNQTHMTTLDYSRPSSKVHPSLEWDNVLGSADGLFRGTVESLHQALYLYRPIWSDGRIVDLEIVYCNAAASALPFTARIVPGALASDVFNDPELAMREAGTTWAFGETEPYSVLRHGLIDGIESSIRYEIHTRRIANFILQTSTDHTIADELQRTEARQRMVLDSLNEGVTLLSPVFDDDQRMIGTRALYSNKTAQPSIASPGATSPSDHLPRSRPCLLDLRWQTKPCPN